MNKRQSYLPKPCQPRRPMSGPPELYVARKDETADRSWGERSAVSRGQTRDTRKNEDVCYLCSPW